MNPQRTLFCFYINLWHKIKPLHWCPDTRSIIRSTEITTEAVSFIHDTLIVILPSLVQYLPGWIITSASSSDFHKSLWQQHLLQLILDRQTDRRTEVDPWSPPPHLHAAIHRPLHFVRWPSVSFIKVLQSPELLSSTSTAAMCLTVTSDTGLSLCCRYLPRRADRGLQGSPVGFGSCAKESRKVWSLKNTNKN